MLMAVAAVVVGGMYAATMLLGPKAPNPVKAEPFECGKGWSFSHFSIRMREPSYAPLTGFPLAWSRGTNGVVSAEPVLAVLKEDAHLEKFKGKLKGKIVLIDEPRKIELNTRALGSRYSERQLEERALAPDPEKP